MGNLLAFVYHTEKAAPKNHPGTDPKMRFAFARFVLTPPPNRERGAKY
jgi:hypothetical protein